MRLTPSQLALPTPFEDSGRATQKLKRKVEDSGHANRATRESSIV